MLWEDLGRTPNSLLGIREAFTEELMPNPNPKGQRVSYLKRRKGQAHSLYKSHICKTLGIERVNGTESCKWLPGLQHQQPSSGAGKGNFGGPVKF